MKTLIKIAFVLACLLFIFGCTSQSGGVLGYEQIPIAQVKANPSLFSKGKAYVEITGVVTGGFNFFEKIKYVEICGENNDCIYAKPLNALPPTGSKVKLIGNTYQVFSLKDNSLVIFEEKISN